MRLRMALIYCFLLIPWQIYAGDSPISADIRITDYLTKAEQALVSDRLTTPAGDNAVAYIEHALVISPEHPDAIQLLEGIIKRYGELVTRNLKRGEQARQRSFEQALIFRDRAYNVITQFGMSNSVLISINRKIKKYSEPFQNGTTGFGHTVMSSDMKAKELADRHIALSKSALDRADIEEAKWHIRQAGLVLEQYRSNQKDTNRRVRDLINFHVTLGELALNKDDMDNAQKHKVLAEELASRYGIKESHLEVFSTRLVEKDLWLNPTPKLRLYGTF